MIGTLQYLLELRDLQRISIALNRGALARSSRRVDLARPETWEFSGFSQNGEDGIIDVLRGELMSANRYFVEIGSASGTENNSAWLLVAEQCYGLMVEGDPKLSRRSQRALARYGIGTQFHSQFVTRENVAELKELALFADPDVFSLDVDGNDYYLAETLFRCGFRPKIFVVEYNSVFGPDRPATIQYRDDFEFGAAHPTRLYYGVSIAGWKTFFARQGYRFVTVDRNGVNAFFVDPAWFSAQFLDCVEGLGFAENRYQLSKFRKPWQDQLRLIEGQPFHAIE
jgi:hypothetical protein